MMWLLLLGHAFAADPPPPPELSSPVPGQCAQSYAIHEGVEAAAALFDGRVAACGGVVVPTSYLADMMAFRVYGEQVVDLYRIDTLALEEHGKDLQAQIETLNAPIPWHKTPSASRWIGRAEGLVVGALVGAIGWQMYQTSVALDR